MNKQEKYLKYLNGYTVSEAGYGDSKAAYNYNDSTPGYDDSKAGYESNAGYNDQESWL